MITTDHCRDYIICRCSVHAVRLDTDVQPYVYTSVGMVKAVTGGYKVQYHEHGPDHPPLELDFTPPFKRVSMIAELEKQLNVKFPSPTTLHTEETRQFLDKLCIQHNVECSSPRTSARLLDKVCQLCMLNPE